MKNFIILQKCHYRAFHDFFFILQNKDFCEIKYFHELKFCEVKK